MIKPEQLHKWYLEAVNNLNTSDYNVRAEVPYEELTDGARYIDEYIAKRINEYQEDSKWKYYGKRLKFAAERLDAALNDKISKCPHCGEELNYTTKIVDYDTPFKCRKCGKTPAFVTPVGAYAYLCSKCMKELFDEIGYKDGVYQSFLEG